MASPLPNVAISHWLVFDTNPDGTPRVNSDLFWPRIDRDYPDSPPSPAPAPLVKAGSEAPKPEPLVKKLHQRGAQCGGA